MPDVCSHERTQVVARREGVDYVRCQDCGQIFEADDLELIPAVEEEEPRGLSRVNRK